MNKPFRFLATIAIASLVIAACGGAATTAAPVATQPPAPTQAQAATQPPVATEAPTAVPATATPAGPKILKVRLPSDPQNADPAFWIGTEEPIMLSVYEGLVGFKPGTWEVVNMLAESVTPSADGLRIDFKLKEGVQFHGGYGEVTADDVKFSYERIADPNLKSPYAGDWGALDHVEVTGKYTGAIILKEPFAALWTSTLPYMSGSVLSKKAVEELGDKYPTHPIGTGPYELVEWKPKESYVLKRFDKYWGPKPEWDEIDLPLIVEDSASEIALDTGEVDFSQISTGSIDRYQTNDKFKVVKETTIDYYWIGMNVQHPKLKDINVREAIRHAIDVPSIIEAAWDGKWTRACAIIAPGQIGYWADAPCYDRDVEKSKEFLKKAGLNSLDLTLWYSQGEFQKAIAEVVQSNLKDVGINVELVAMDDATFSDAPFGDKGLQNMQLVLVQFITEPDPSWSVVWFTCAQVKVWNWPEWCSKQFDDLHFAALKELDPAKRADMYIQLQKLWDAEANVVWLAYPTWYFAGRADLEPSFTPHGRLLVWNFHSK